MSFLRVVSGREHVEIGFYWILLGLVLFQVSFMGLPGAGVEGARASSLAVPKFIMQSFGFLCLLRAWWYKRSFLVDRPFVLISGYLFLCFFSILISYIDGRLFDYIGSARIISMAYLLVFFIWARGVRESTVISLVYCSMLIPVIVIIIAYFVDSNFVYRVVYSGSDVLELRLGGDVIPPNTFGGILGVASIFSLFYTTKKMSPINLLIFIGLVIMLYLTKSRGAMVSFFASAPFVLYRTNRFGRMFLFGLCALSIAVLFFWGMNSFFSERQLSGVSDFGGRSALWGQGVKYFIKSGLVGWFFGSGYMLPDAVFYTGSLKTNSLHNGYFQVICGVGLLGATIYCLIWYRLLVRGWRGQSGVVFAVCLFCLIFNFSELGGLVLPNSFTLLCFGFLGSTAAARNFHARRLC